MKKPSEGIDSNNIDPAYWEKVLTEGGHGLLEESQESVKDNTVTLLPEGSAEDLQRYLEGLDNITIGITPEKGGISFWDNSSSTLIGELYTSTYTDGNIYINDHLYFKLSDKFKGKGFGNKMFLMYQRLCEESEDFAIPETEYTNLTSMVFFYEKHGFEIVGKRVSGMNVITELTGNDLALMNQIRDDYYQGIEEEYLDFTVELRKIS